MRSLYAWGLCFATSYISMLTCFIAFRKQFGSTSLFEDFFGGILVYVFFGVICGTLGYLTLNFTIKNVDRSRKMHPRDLLLPAFVSISSTVIVFYGIFLIARSG